MANYFLKSSDNAKAYRVAYSSGNGKLTIDGCYCSGNGVTLPSGPTVAGVDVPVKVDDVLVDFALGTVAPATVSNYRSIAAAVETGLASAEVTSYAEKW